MGSRSVLQHAPNRPKHHPASIPYQPKASDAIFISYKTVMFTTRCFNVIHSTLLLLRHASGEFIFYVVHAIPLKENGKGVLKSEMCSIFIQDEQ